MSLMAPKFILNYRGIDISSEVAPHLTECTYTDKVHGEADEIEVTVQDKDGLWRGPWCPQHGDTVVLAMGYEGGIMVPCGAFEIDEPEARCGRDGDSFTFRGLSAPITKSLRTAKTRGYDHQSVKQIADKVAGEHGLTVTGTPPDLKFERVTQRRERDLEFLSRLADQFGCYFAVRGSQLCFTQRSLIHAQAPVLLVRHGSGDYISAELKRASHETYSKAKVSYFHGNKKKIIDVEVADPQVRNGDTLRIDERVEDEEQAKVRAKSELEKENLKKQTATLELPGAPLALAGSMVALDAGFGQWAGTYVIQSSRHQISRSGYTTSLELAATGGAGG